MHSHISSAAEVMNWNRKILGLLGIWPNDPRNIRFSLIVGYLIIHVTLEYAYLYQNIKQLENVVASMTENIPFTVVLLKAVLFRKNKNLLCKIIRKINKNFEIGDYRSDQELEIFLRYNKIAKNFVRIVVPLLLSSSIVYFAKPLFTKLLTRGNGTVNYDLPYRIHQFYDITDVHVYMLTYAFQMPLVLIATFGYTGIDCLLVTLTLHVCGELSILANRIENLKCNTRGAHEAIKILIDRHVQLIRMVRIIEDVFNVLLLGQLFGGTLLICFLGYNVLATLTLLQNTTGGQETDLVKFLLYGFTLLVLLYVYCYVGDCLIHESVKVRDAFFYCAWYELPAKNSKSFVICIIQSQKPLHLTAGKFVVFSWAIFANVIETSTAYLSVLRNFL